MVSNRLALLRAVGEALWGPRWQTEMAREIGVAKRTVQRWDAGANDVPDAAFIALAKVAAARVDALGAIMRRLARIARCTPAPRDR